MSLYNFTKAPVNIDRLTIEINTSSISSAEYQYASFTSPNLELYFDGDLSGSDQTTLNNIVSAHSGLPIFIPEGMVAIANGGGGIDFVSILNPEVVTTSGITANLNLDGGAADTLYGGTSPLDAGSASTNF